jgi:hypothetical protein
LSQIVTLTFFQFNGFFNRLWAFRAIGIYKAKLNTFPEITFSKLMGSGGDGGFGILPNFGIYSLLCCFNNINEAEHFIKHNAIFEAFKYKSAANNTVFLTPISSHGAWDGQNPFQNSKEKTDGKIAVITRGKIKLKNLLQFWRYVSPASHNMKGHKGLLYSIGIGELPIIQQATFSVWQNTEKMMDYAYKSHQHTQVIKKTRELGWYSEELFARFIVLKTEGNQLIF